MITESARITPDVVMRPAAIEDADALARARLRSRAHLEPWEPSRPEDYFTSRAQAARLRDQLEECRAGRAAPWVLDREGDIVGSVTLSTIVLGPLRSGSLGYWIDVDHVGKGLATAAVAYACESADRELGLHRVDAGTLLDNVPSQRVLAKCGFEEYGVAPAFLHINGAWRDHRLFQRILNDRTP
ncbi:GNAT family N-acetyltransferase [Streptomyces sp. NPDC057302]|uniref:GNAT family N-acetyltransferase n=1 Tax=Streptomyces sp. NPDC057302 TaxID=3346094 RepID=UPI0036413E61